MKLDPLDFSELVESVHELVQAHRKRLGLPPYDFSKVRPGRCKGIKIPGYTYPKQRKGRKPKEIAKGASAGNTGI